jgi:hypothetical protein
LKGVIDIFAQGLSSESNFEVLRSGDNEKLIFRNFAMAERANFLLFSPQNGLPETVVWPQDT